MRHLSDDIIQEYLDTKDSARTEMVNSHLVICPACKEKLESYRDVYLQLSVEPEFELGRNFNKKVIRTIDTVEIRAKMQKYVYAFAVMVGVFSILFVLDFLGTISINAIYNAVSVNISGWMTPTISTISALIGKLNGNLEILAFAGVAALIFQFLDHSIVQSKLKRF